MGKPPRLIVASAVALLLLLVFAPATSAECSPGSLPPKADEHLTVRDAFVATVTEASASVDPNPDGAAYDWHLELAVEATYKGRVPKVLIFNGREGGSCGDLVGEALRTGDRIIIAAEDLRPRYQPAVPFEGHMVLWQQTSDGWSFFADALTYGADPQAYPKTARDANTKAEILRVILSDALPETSTGLAPSKPIEPDPALIADIAFALGFALGLRRFRSRQTVATGE